MNWRNRARPRWLRHEFWPTYTFYIPFFFLWLYYAIRLRKLFYFTAVNPGMTNGGLFNSPKEEIMSQWSLELSPRTVLIEENQELSDECLRDLPFAPPLISKPTMGWRGYGIEFCRSLEELKRLYPLGYPAYLQEYIDYDHEFGVFIFQEPDTRRFHITGIVGKGFLRIVGDGLSTFGELVANKERAYGRLAQLRARYGDLWDQVVLMGKEVMVEPIGNHNRGTIFYDCSELINERVLGVFAHLMEQLDEVYWGRFDVKVPTPKSLETGEGIKIIEFNGCMAEPVHMYDPNHSIWRTYSILMRHGQLNYRVAKENIRNGHKPLTINQFFREWRTHKAYRSKLLTRD